MLLAYLHFIPALKSMYGYLCMQVLYIFSRFAYNLITFFFFCCITLYIYVYSFLSYRYVLDRVTSKFHSNLSQHGAWIMSGTHSVWIMSGMHSIQIMSGMHSVGIMFLKTKCMNFMLLKLHICFKKGWVFAWICFKILDIALFFLLQYR